MSTNSYVILRFILGEILGSQVPLDIDVFGVGPSTVERVLLRLDRGQFITTAGIR